MPGYGTISTPIRPRHTGVSRLFVIQRRILAQQSASYLLRTPLDLLSPQAGFAWNIFGDGKTVLRGGAGIFRDQFPVYLFGIDRFLPPFFSINSFVFPSFLNPQNALVTQPLDLFSMTYHPKFPYALQYNLNLEREIAPGTILSAGYFGARGNHLPREVEAEPFRTSLRPSLQSELAFTSIGGF